MLELISEFLNKQEVISKLTESEKLHGMGFTDVHIVVSIGELDHANVTKIAEQMHMTRSAISKAMKRLERQDCVRRYTEPDNQKEVYFVPTDYGNLIIEEHRKRHQLWEAQDRIFLDRFTDQEKVFLEDFFRSYNRYLEDKIREMESER